MQGFSLLSDGQGVTKGITLGRGWNRLERLTEPYRAKRTRVRFVRKVLGNERMFDPRPISSNVCSGALVGGLIGDSSRDYWPYLYIYGRRPPRAISERAFRHFSAWLTQKYFDKGQDLHMRTGCATVPACLDVDDIQSLFLFLRGTRSRAKERSTSRTVGSMAQRVIACRLDLSFSAYGLLSVRRRTDSTPSRDDSMLLESLLILALR